MTEMGRLKRALEAKAINNGHAEMKVHMPKNCETVEIAHRSEKLARVIGSLASEPMKDKSQVQGLLVRKDFDDVLINQSDLSEFTKLRSCSVKQKQTIPMSKPMSSLRFALEGMFEGLHTISGAMDKERETISIEEHLTIVKGAPSAGAVPHIVMEWDSNPISDLLADSVVAMVLQIEDEPQDLAGLEAALKSAQGDEKQAAVARLRIARALMAAQFGEVDIDETEGILTFTVGGEPVAVYAKDGKVECGPDPLRERVEQVVQRIAAAIQPLPC